MADRRLFGHNIGGDGCSGLPPVGGDGTGNALRGAPAATGGLLVVATALAVLAVGVLALALGARP